MSKNEKESAIIEAIKTLPETGYGAYQYQESLVRIIDKVMGYEEMRFPHGRIRSKEIVKVSEIVRRMVDKKIITISKSGTMFKLN